MKLQSSFFTLLLSVFYIYSSFGKTFIVNDLYPFSEGVTFEKAINDANATFGRDTIEFSTELQEDDNITINIINDIRLTDLSGVYINGDFDNDGVPNVTIQKEPVGKGATEYKLPEIQNETQAYGIFIESGSANNIVNGVHFNNTYNDPLYAIVIADESSNNTITNCYLGVSQDGFSYSDKNNSKGSIYIAGANNTIIDNLIGGYVEGFSQAGIFIDGINAKENIILGNIIGVNLNLENRITNSYGIRVVDAPNTVIGDTGSDQQNLIGGNNRGIYLKGAANTKIINNYVGITPTGINIKNNNGIFIEGATNTTIGGIDNAHGNVFCSNGAAINIFNPEEGGSPPFLNTSIAYNYFGFYKYEKVGIISGAGNSASIVIEGVDGSNIHHNLIGNSTSEGIYLFLSNENEIYANEFFDNAQDFNFTDSNLNNDAPKNIKIVNNTITGEAAPFARIQVYVASISNNSNRKSYLKDVIAGTDGDWTITLTNEELQGVNRVYFLEDLEFSLSTYLNTSPFSEPACIGLENIEFTVGDETTMCQYGILQLHDKTDPNRNIVTEFGSQNISMISKKDSFRVLYNNPFVFESDLILFDQQETTLKETTLKETSFTLQSESITSSSPYFWEVWPNINSEADLGKELFTDTVEVTINTHDGVCSITDKVKVIFEDRHIEVNPPIGSYVMNPDTILSAKILSNISPFVEEISSTWSISKGELSTKLNNSIDPVDVSLKTPDYKVNSQLSIGENTFKFTHQTKRCTYEDSTTYFHLLANSTGIDAGESEVICPSSRQYQLNGSYPGTTEIGLWTVKSGGSVNFVTNNPDMYGEVPEEDPKAIITGLPGFNSKKIELYWTIFDQQGAILKKDSVTIDYRPPYSFNESHRLSVCSDTTNELNPNLPPTFYDDFNFTWYDANNTGDLFFETPNTTSTRVIGIQENKDYDIIFEGKLDRCTIQHFFPITRPSQFSPTPGFNTVTIANKETTYSIQIDNNENEGSIRIKNLDEKNTSITKYVGFNQDNDWKYEIQNIPIGENIFLIEDLEFEGCFVNDTFSITRRLIANPIKDQTVCGISDFTLKAGGFVGKQTGSWSILTQPAGASAVIDSKTQTTTTAIVTGATVAGQYEFIWALTENGFTDYDTIAYTVGLPLTNFLAHPTLDTLVVENNISNIVELNAVNGHIGDKIIGTWSSGVGISYFDEGKAQSTTNANNKAIVGRSYQYHTFYWTANDICQTQDTLVIAVVPKVDAGIGQTICSTEKPIPLKGSVLTDEKINPTYQWDLISRKPSAEGVIITKPTLSTTEASIKFKGSYTFKYTIIENGLSNSDTVTFIVKDTVGVSLNSPSSINFVSFYPEYTLEAGGDNDTILWTPDVGATAIIDDLTATRTKVTNLQVGINNFKLTDEDKVCKSSSIGFSIEYKRIVNAGENVSTCDNTPISLSGSAEGVTSLWTALPPGIHGNYEATKDGSNIKLTDPTLPTTSIELIDDTKPGDYVLVLQITDGLHFDYDTITATFSKSINLIFDGPTVTTTDSIKVKVIDKNSPTNPLVGSWKILDQQSPSFQFEDATSPITVLQNMPFGGSRIRWIGQNGACSNLILEEVVRLPKADIITTKNKYCQNEVISLEADTSQFQENRDIKGAWFNANGNVIDDNPPYDISGLPAGTNTLLVWRTYIEVTISIGEGFETKTFINKDSIYVDIAPFALAKINMGSDTITTTLDSVNILADATGITQTWSSPNLDISFDAPTENGTIVRNLPVGYTTLYWNTGVDDCQSKDSLVIFREIFVDAGFPQSICTPDLILQGSQPDAGQTGLWASTSPNVSFEDPTLFNTKVTFTALGLNELVWTVSENGFDFSAKVDIDVLDIDTINTGFDMSIEDDFATVTASGDLDKIEWTVLSPQNSGIVIVNPTSAITDITNLVEGENVFLLLDKDACPTQDTLKIVYTKTQFIANRDEVFVDEDNFVIVNVSTNDEDVDNQIDFSTLKIKQNVRKGFATLDLANGEITYFPTLNYSGKDSLIYELCSVNNGCDTAYLVFDITQVNDTIEVNTDFTFVNEDETLFNYNVINNDVDVDTPVDASTVTIISGPENGIAINNSDGTINYTPFPNFYGLDSLIYKACAIDGICDTAYVYIDVIPVNDNIIANRDETTTDEETLVSINVLTNDIDIDFGIDTSSLTIFADVTNGITSVNTTTGEITYSPNKDFFGKDSLIYEIYGKNGTVDTAYFVITVNNVIDDVIANQDVISTDEEVATTINVVTNDIDVDFGFDLSSLKVTTDVTNGASVVNNTTGEITYTPKKNFFGRDSLIYEISGENNTKDTAYVKFTVINVNDEIVIVDDTITVKEDEPVIVNVTTNDVDIDGEVDFSTLEIVIDPNDGVASVNTTTGEITYTPNQNFFGKDSLRYRLCSKDGSCGFAYVRFKIPAVNDPVVANGDFASVNEDESVTINVAVNDTEIDAGEQLDLTRVSIFENPKHGQVVINPTSGEITYSPDLNFNGRDSLIYTMFSTDNTSDTAYIKIDVISVNDSIIANKDIINTPENTTVTLDVIANDVDVDDPIDLSTLSIITLVNKGTIDSVNTITGEITYTPDLNFLGRDSVIYEIFSTDGTSDTAYFVINVTNVNDTIVANDDDAITNEDEFVTLNVTTNDQDIDAADQIDLSLLTISTNPKNGIALVNTTTGEITYTPNQDYFGKDSLVYKIFSTDGTSDTAYVRFDIIAINDNIVVNEDAASTNENTEIEIDVVANDVDIDNLLNLASLSVNEPPKHGQVTIHDEKLVYIPDFSFNGKDSLIYELCSDDGSCDTAYVKIDILSVNDPFIATLDTASVDEDQSIRIDVAINDIDIDGLIDFSRLTIISDPTKGIAIPDTSSGEIVYTPNENFFGKDSLIYELCSDDGTCDTAYVKINVISVDDPISVNRDEITINENESATVNVTLNDFDVEGLNTSSLFLINDPNNGFASADTTTGEITYTPFPNTNGKDSLIYQLCSIDGDCDTAYFVINIDSINSLFVANDDDVITNEDQPIEIDVAINDKDIDGQINFSELLVSNNPIYGSFVIINNNILYSPNENFFGQDSLEYKLCSDDGTCDKAIVRITVISINDPFKANDDTVFVDEDQSIEIDVAANDVDGDGDPIDFTSLEIVTNTTNAFVDTINNKILYTPKQDFFGKDSIVYRLCSTTNGDCDLAVVRITVNPTNDPFEAVPDFVIVDEDRSIEINVISNDTDGDGSGFDFSKLNIDDNANPQNGKIQIINNTIVYSPNPNFNGNDSFIYEICSNNNACDTALVNITINPVNDPIVANLDNVTVRMNEQGIFNTTANDFDIDVNDIVDTLSIRVITNSVNGQAIVNSATGKISYTPTQDFFGKDSLIYEVCSTDGTCDTAYVKINVTEKLIANAGNDTTFCGLKSTLNAETVVTVGYIGYWSTTNLPGGVQIETTNPKSNITVDTPGEYSFTWVIEKNGQIESQDVVKVTSLLEPTASIAQSNFNTDEAVITLEGDTDSEPVFSWSSSTSATIENPNSAITNISNLELGINFFTLSVGEVCINEKEIAITYFNPFVADAGKDTVICENSFELNAAPIPSDATGKWIPLLVNANTIENPTERTTKVTNLPSQKVGYIWEVTNGFKTKSDTILIGVSLNDPVTKLVENITIQTKFAVDINPEKIDYNTYTYEIINQKFPEIGTTTIDNLTDSLLYSVRRAALGYDTIIYSITDQCERSATNTLSLFILNSKPLEGDAFATAKSKDTTTFNVLDSIYIFDRNYNIRYVVFTKEQSVFGAEATVDSLTGEVLLDYEYVTEIGLDSLEYTVCDDSSRCLTAYLKINVVHTEGYNQFDQPKVMSVLSPNDDGIHDFVRIDNLSFDSGEPKYPDSKFTIFDRWGRIIRTIEGYDNKSERWEGRDNNGDLVPQGTYYYSLEYSKGLFKSGFILVNY